MDLSEWTNKRVRLVIYIILFIGVGTVVFDVLRKTFFLNASWNYRYPFWNFVYDWPVFAMLVGLSAVIIRIYPRLLELSERKFAGALYGLTISVFMVALFALPLETKQAFDVHWRGLHNAAVFFVENGVVEFLSSFHTLPGSVPEHTDLTIFDHEPNPHEMRADQVGMLVRNTEWIPFNTAIGDCISTIIAQKHGPGSVFLVVPFVWLFGKSVTATALGSFGLAALIPVIGFALYRQFFHSDIARTVALLTAFAPVLFFFTRQGSPVPYDVFTGLYLSITLLLFLRGLERNDPWSYAGAGITFALALLTKLTALFIVLTLLGLAYIYIRQQESKLWPLGASVGTASALPLVLLVGGYNFICQLAFTGIKFFIGSRGDGSPAANSNLADPVIARLAPAYNARWMSIPLFVFVGVFLWSVLSKRSLEDDVDIIAVLMLCSLAPFIIYLIAATGTLSRHMVPFLVPFGFVAARGLERVVEARRQLLLVGRLSLMITFGSFLINI